MSLQSIIFKSTLALSIALVVFLGFSMSSQIAHAATPTVKLWVSDAENGLPVSSVSKGQEVWFMWEITGTVSGCSIDHDVGPVPFNTGSNSLKYTSTLSGNVTFKITCGGITASQPPVNTAEPIVTMGITQGQNLSIDSTIGYVRRVDVTWESQNADECGIMWRVKESAPGVKIPENKTDDYWFQGARSGSVRYDGNPRSISETTTFYITCTNNNTDVSKTSSVTVTVDDPEPPEDPTIEMWTSTPTVVQDELYGWATANVGFDSDDATWCEQSAYHKNGVRYNPNPSGWDFSNKREYESSNILIAETTTFEVICGRDAVTVGGIYYPAAEPVKKEIKIEVKPPPTIPKGDWDRTKLPPVEATISANPTLAPKNPISDMASSVITVHSENADYCKLKAYEFKGASEQYKEYTVGGWSDRTISGNTDWSTTVALGKKTRLEVDCRRDYDLEYGDAAEKVNGQAIEYVVVEVSDSYIDPEDPIAYVYGNAVVIDIEEMWGIATKRIGWDNIRNKDSLRYLESNLSSNKINSISFPFTHPFGTGTSDQYDIHFRYCDEEEGISTFSFYVNEEQVSLDLITDRPDSSDDECNWSTTYTDIVASAIPIADGDIFTIKCSSESSDEKCRFSGIYFGAGNGGSVQAAGSPADVSLLWLSKNATKCDSFVATGKDGSTDTWHKGGKQTSGTESVSISQDTTFSVACGLNTGTKDESEVKVTVDSVGEVIDYAGLEYGDCRNAVGDWIESPPGMFPDPTIGPTEGNCIPLVDLAATEPSVDISSWVVNNLGIDGTYSNVFIRMGIKNLGPGNLLVNSGVTYLSRITNLTFPPPALPTLETPLGTFMEFLPPPPPPPPVIESKSGILILPVNDPIKFGVQKVEARVNLDGSPNFPEGGDPTNNIYEGQVTLPVPEPPMSITATPNIIRKGESSTISWSAHTSYPLDCIVRGAGEVNDGFDASDSHPSAYTNFKKTTFTSTSEFILRCTEEKTSTTFEKKVRLEVVPGSEEI